MYMPMQTVVGNRYLQHKFSSFTDMVPTGYCTLVINHNPHDYDPVL